MVVKIIEENNVKNIFFVEKVINIIAEKIRVFNPKKVAAYMIEVKVGGIDVAVNINI